MSAEEVDDDVIVISSAEALAVDAKAYAEIYDVTLDEAAKRIAVMTGDFTDIAMIETQEGDDIAGSYFDNNSEFAFVINTTKEKQTEKQIKVKAKEVRKAEKDKRKADRKTIQELRKQLKSRTLMLKLLKNT